MSNYSRVDLRIRRAQQECRNDLNQCANDCLELSSSFNRNFAALNEMRADIQKLKTMSTDIEKIPDLMTEISKTASRLEEVLTASQRNAVELERAGKKILEDAQGQTNEMEYNLSLMDDHLQELRQKISEGLKQAFEIGIQLEKQFEASQQIVDGIAVQKDVNQQLESRIDISWEQAEGLRAGMANLRKGWTDFNASMTDEYGILSQHIQDLSLIISSLDSSAEASYAIVKKLSDDNFKLASFQRSKNGMEAFLKDQEGRLISVQVNSNTKIEDSILLGLNLSEFDPVKKYKNCNQKLTEILERLTDLGVIAKRKTENPHKKGKGGRPKLMNPIAEKRKVHKQSGRLKT